MLLKELTELNGVSGNEDEVREYIRKEALRYATEVKVDSMGNVIAYKKGSSSGFRLMLAAHMDEVGLMVTGYGEGGTLKFKPVGGIDERILPGKRVLVGDRKLPGVIGCKPVHLQEKEERNNNIKLKSLYIDIGAEKKEEAEKLAPLGEYVAFYSEYTELGEECIKAKGLDDRVGCAVLLEALKGSYGFDLYACFTVQEEVGLRGAGVAAYAVQPHAAIVVEGTTCSDVPGAEAYEYSTLLGGGAALTLMDRTAYGDRLLVDYIHELAKKNNINIQFKQTATGGNDAGKIQASRAGVRVVAVSVPCRYIHSPVSVMSKKDFESCRQIICLALDELGKNPELMERLKDGGNGNV